MRPLFLLAIAAGLSTHAVHAAGTAAGTAVVNQARVSYTLGGVTGAASSNAASFNVAEVLDVNVTLQSPQVSVIAGEARRALLFRLTNVGNGAEGFALSVDNALAGDDFDPQTAAPAIYFDTDASGDHSAADIAYVPGSNDPSLAADAALTLIVLNDIPAGVGDGLAGRSELQARALTGSGSPGTVFAGQGEGGTDAMAGANGARSDAFGEYVVGEAQVALVKSAIVSDPAGGERPMPGARIEYRILVNVSGSGTARALQLNDPIPGNTTYVAGSLRLNDLALTDASDTDFGEFQGGAAARVHIALGDLTQASGTQTVAFSVTIN